MKIDENGILKKERRDSNRKNVSFKESGGSNTVEDDTSSPSTSPKDKDLHPNAATHKSEDTIKKQTSADRVPPKAHEKDEEEEKKEEKKPDQPPPAEKKPEQPIEMDLD